MTAIQKVCIINHIPLNNLLFAGGLVVLLTKMQDYLYNTILTLSKVTKNHNFKISKQNRFLEI